MYHHRRVRARGDGFLRADDHRVVGLGGISGVGELRALCRLGLAHRDGIAHGLGPELAHRCGGASGAWCRNLRGARACELRGVK